MKTKYLVHIMVFEVVTCDGNIMPHSSFQMAYDGTEVKKKCSEEVVLI